MRHVLAAAVAAAILSTAPAAAHQRGCHTRRCDRHAARACNLHAACMQRVRRRREVRVVRAWAWWLGPTGACESGTDTNLRHGLRATSPGGMYLGRYQFDRASWAGAGGRGDPRNADWVEQGFRAVRWRAIAGPGAWPVCGH